MRVPTDQEIDAALEGFYNSISNYTNSANISFSIGISRELLRSHSNIFALDRMLNQEKIKISGARAAVARSHPFRSLKIFPSHHGDDFHRAAAAELAELFQRELEKDPDTQIWFYQPAVYAGIIIDPASFEPRIAIRSRYVQVPKPRG